MAQKRGKTESAKKKAQDVVSAPDDDVASPGGGSGSGRPVDTYFRWRAPFPPPNVIESFGDVIENGAERVFSQFEMESQHRRTVEAKAVNAECRDLLLGKVFAFIFVMAMIGTAIFAIVMGYPVLSGFLGASVLSSVVGAFVYVRGSDKPDDD